MEKKRAAQISDGKTARNSPVVDSTAQQLWRILIFASGTPLPSPRANAPRPEGLRRARGAADGDRTDGRGRAEGVTKGHLITPSRTAAKSKYVLKTSWIGACVLAPGDHHRQKKSLLSNSAPQVTQTRGAEISQLNCGCIQSTKSSASLHQAIICSDSAVLNAITYPSSWIAHNRFPVLNFP